MGYQKPGSELHSVLKYAPISGTGSTTTEIVPLVAGKRIRVMDYHLQFASGVTAIWKSDTTALSGTLVDGATVGRDDGGHFQTAAGEPLNLTHTGDVGGHMNYIEVEEVS